MTPRRAAHRRGMSLIESVLVIAALAVTVPMGLDALRQADRSRRAASDGTAATLLAQAVLEQTIADAASADVGFDSFDDATAYLDTPDTGLRDRLATISEPYEIRGITWDLEVGDLVAADGEPNEDEDTNAFRRVTVEVAYGTGSRARTLRLGVMLTELAP